VVANIKKRGGRGMGHGSIQTRGPPARQTGTVRRAAAQE
jgi:hypothetical protein